MQPTLEYNDIIFHLKCHNVTSIILHISFIIVLEGLFNISIYISVLFINIYVTLYENYIYLDMQYSYFYTVYFNIY